MTTQAENQLVNETLFEQLATPGMEKEAIDAVNDFTRAKMREDGFYRRILLPLQVSNNELDRQVHTVTTAWQDHQRKELPWMVMKRDPAVATAGRRCLMKVESLSDLRVL